MSIDERIAIEVMEWIPPLPLPDGNYESIYQNEEFCIGPVVGYRHTNTGATFTLEEFEKFQYWTTKDGKPAKAPWGGLITKWNFYNWKPSTDKEQTFIVIEKMRKDGYIFDISSIGSESWSVIIRKGNKYTYQFGDFSMTVCLGALALDMTGISNE